MGARVETTDGHAPVVIEGGGLKADPLRAAGGERPGEVGGAARRAARGRRHDARRRAATRRATTPSACSRALGVRGRAARPPRSRSRRSTGCRRSTIGIPGDFSSAAPFVVAATLAHRLGAASSQGVNVNPTRTGFLDVLERMGARDRRLRPARASAASRSPTSRCARPPLDRDEVEAAEVPRLIDELPLVALAAAHGARRDRRPRRRRAARQGNGSDRDRDELRCEPSACASRRATMASG